MEEQIIEKNKKYWDDHADLWFGTTALPKYGVKFATEDDLHFFRRLKERKSSRYAAAVGIRSNILRIKAQKSCGD